VGQPLSFSKAEGMNRGQFKLLALKFLALSGMIIMSMAVAYAFSQGDFAKEGATLTESPWGILTLVDVYIGFVLFSCWVILREEHVLTASFWIASIMILGNIISCLYLFIALIKSNGDKKTLLLGHTTS
jgi:hypothetical protein